MKVKELIEQLSKHNPEAEVIHREADGVWSIVSVDKRHVVPEDPKDIHDAVLWTIVAENQLGCKPAIYLW